MSKKSRTLVLLAPALGISRRISDTGDVQKGLGRDSENTAERVATREPTEPEPLLRSSTPPAEGLSFSETRELVLSMGSMKFMLDLDSGETMSAPARPDRHSARMDIHTDQSQPYLYPTGLSGAPSSFLSGSLPL